MIFDTHAHYDDEAYNEDREAVICSLEARGVGFVVNSGAGMKSSAQAVELAKRYKNIYASVGVHPDNAGEVNDESLAQLRKWCLEEKVLAIGEIGLDYHWDVWPREVQLDAFTRQWNLADELGLPVVIHSRDAAETTMDFIKQRLADSRKAERDFRAELHCYSYSPEHAAEYVKMGMYFGIGGVVTFKNARKLIESVEIIPMENILLETDAPYLAPEPFRGKRNSSAYISYVAERIAQIKGIPADEVIRITEENAWRFYGYTRRSEKYD